MNSDRSILTLPAMLPVGTIQECERAGDSRGTRGGGDLLQFK
ncbi:MAG: hypothetical protein JWL84_282 [Rhodospirillales bacterium]|nr:hypothetical protein [Rhodospirillales bacterium]